MKSARYCVQASLSLEKTVSVYIRVVSEFMSLGIWVTVESLWQLNSLNSGHRGQWEVARCALRRGWWRGDSSLNVSASVCRLQPTSLLSTECWLRGFRALTPAWLQPKFIFNMWVLDLLIFFPSKTAEQASYRRIANMHGEHVNAAQDSRTFFFSSGWTQSLLFSMVQLICFCLHLLTNVKICCFCCPLYCCRQTYLSWMTSGLIKQALNLHTWLWER